jgi:DNA (cytosine-5)-methyltransferase 1
MAFIFENVRGLESSNDGKDLRRIRDRLEGDYYESEYRVLNAANFGVPQTRKRIFIIGVSDGEPQFPEPTHNEEGANGKEEWVTVGQALEKFDIDQNIEEKGGYQNAIGSKYGKLLRDIPEGANYQHFSERRYDPQGDEYVNRDEQETYEKHFEWRSRHWNYLLKMDRNRPSWTLQAAPGSTVGPFHWRARKLSLIEQMELMTLPTDYYIAGLPGEIQSQVGNSVPPVLAEKVARTLATSLGLDVDLPDSTRAGTKSGKTAQTDGQPPFTIEVTHDHSPWHHADRIIPTLLSTNAVVVQAEGRAVPLALDALEIARRQSEIDFDIVIKEIIKEGDSWKGGVASVLQAKVLTEDATVEITIV